MEEIIPVYEARTVETVIFGFLLPGGEWILFGGRLVVEISSIRRLEKQDSEE